MPIKSERGIQIGEPNLSGDSIHFSQLNLLDYQAQRACAS
jgi:hypothetical protein